MASGLQRDRVVAVVAELENGLLQVGSGFLVAGGAVLTARHCTRDKASGEPPRTLRIFRAADGRELPIDTVTRSAELDVAVVQVNTADPDVLAAESFSSVTYGRIDRSQAGIIADCEAIGYPMFQFDPTNSDRRTAELHGIIYRTDEAETGRLLMREPMLTSVIDPAGVETGNAWGGLSGAVVFHGGLAIGVIVEHHPRQGASAVQLVAFDQIAASADPTTRAVAVAIGLPAGSDLRWADAAPIPPLAGLIELLDNGSPPQIADLNPYALGATASDYGNSASYGEQDPYVARTHNGVDARLAALLEPGRLVLLVGPSKSGKTRTLFEVTRRRWPDARVLACVPGTLGDLASHPRLLATGDRLVVWFDDLQRFVTGTTPLTPTLLRRLTARPGPTIVVATLRIEERDRLRDSTGELSRDTRALLDDAVGSTIELGPTTNDPTEQLAAERSYPDATLGAFGLAEGLAHAPALLRAYRDGAAADPTRSAVVRVAIDWVRVGIERPIPEPDLVALVRDEIWHSAPEVEVDDAGIAAAIKLARAPLPGTGKAALLGTFPLPGHIRGYRPFDYLVAADDGQRSVVREIPEPFWDSALSRATAQDAALVGDSCLYLNRAATAVTAYRVAAAGGERRGMFNLGVLLADVVQPPDLAGARRTYEDAVKAGHPGAALNLGILLTMKIDPPDLPAARAAFETSAAEGSVDGAFNLGVLLSTRLDPPDVPAARVAFERAAAAGHTDAMSNLGSLLLEQVVPPDPQAARHAYEQAAAAGNVNAAYNLGVLLADRLTPPDPVAARAAFEQAASAGNGLAALRVGILLLDHLDPPDVPGARARFEQAMSAGVTDAYAHLGLLLEHRLDPPDIPGAIEAYENAAAAGNTDVLVNVGNLLLTAVDPPDVAGARDAYSRAAAAGAPNAALNLGALLAGYLKPPDLVGARAAYELAAAAGSADAAFRLGVLLSEDLDPPDLPSARTAFEQAGAAGHGQALLYLGLLLLDHFERAERPAAKVALTRAVELGELRAWRRLGNLAITDDPPSLADARVAYGHAAALGDAEAAVQLGYLLAFMLDPPEAAAALAEFAPSMAAGDPLAAYYVGIVLADVLDPPDLAGARAALTQSALAGDPDAAARLETLG